MRSGTLLGMERKKSFAASSEIAKQLAKEHKQEQAKERAERRRELRTPNPAAVELGRKGGKARAAALTPEQRRASAIKAGKARWKDKG